MAEVELVAESTEVPVQIPRFYVMPEAQLPVVLDDGSLICSRHAALNELVPSYLNRVPVDPFGNGALAYQAQGTNWLLYSLGPDCIDDGGRPIHRSLSDDFIGFGASAGKTAKGDVLLDSPW